jgi:hypothetical protein
MLSLTLIFRNFHFGGTGVRIGGGRFLNQLGSPQSSSDSPLEEAGSNRRYRVRRPRCRERGSCRLCLPQRRRRRDESRYHDDGGGLPRDSMVRIRLPPAKSPRSVRGFRRKDGTPPSVVASTRRGSRVGPITSAHPPSWPGRQSREHGQLSTDRAPCGSALARRISASRAVRRPAREFLSEFGFFEQYSIYQMR